MSTVNKKKIKEIHYIINAIIERNTKHNTEYFATQNLYLLGITRPLPTIKTHMSNLDINFLK